MLPSLILFLGLTVATAVIAHWSDNLGKKLGKKRVSLFGLRPRTTATLLTIASSWGIMLFTLVALLIAVDPLRNALFSYERERAEAQKVGERLKVTRERLVTIQDQGEEAAQRLAQTNSELRKTRQAAQKERAAAEKAAGEQKERADKARERAGKAEKAEKAAQKRAASAQKRVASAQKRLFAARRSEAAAARGERKAQRETREAEDEARVAQEEARAAQTSRNQAAEELKSSLFDLKSARISAANAGRSAINARRSAIVAGRQVLEADVKLSQTRTQIAALEAQRRALETYASQTEQFVGNDAPIKVGQTFAARVIAPNQTPAQIVEQLRALLRQGQESFAEDEDNTPQFPSGANLQLLPLNAQDADGKAVVLADEQLLQRLARDTAASPVQKPISIRLVAARNFLANETQIEVIFVAVPIAPAFAAGTILASATIDGTQNSAQGDARIFRSLIDLVNFGQRRAEALGVNPPKSPDEQDFYATGTNVRIFAAFRAINNSKARVQVNLVTSKALSTVEPLQVRFEIEGALDTPTPSRP